MKTLVTGGVGFIGRHLVRFLIEKGHDIIIFDNLSNSSENNIRNLLDKVTFVKVDITDFKTLSDNLSGCDAVIHLAAKISVPDSIVHPEETFRVNVQGTINLLNACAKHKIKNLVAVSTAAVYGDLTNSKLVFSESSHPSPISPYGTSKLAMEEEIKKFSLKNEINSIILRVFNVYGLGQSSEYAGVISRFAENIKDGKNIVIFGDGLQTRDFVSIKDVVNAIKLSMDNIEGKRGEIYNIASGNPLTINDLAKMMILVSGKNIQIQHVEPKKGDIRFSQADVSKAKKELGFFSKVRLQDEIINLMSARRESNS